MGKEHFLRKRVVIQGFEFNYVILTEGEKKRKKPLGIQIELICLPSSLAKNICLMTAQYLS